MQSTLRQSNVNILAPEPPLEPLPVCTHHLYVNTFDTDMEIYIDSFGRFPTLCNSGNSYIFILYEYDSNVILSKSIKIAEFLKWLTHIPKLWTTSQNVDSNQHYRS